MIVLYGHLVPFTFVPPCFPVRWALFYRLQYLQFVKRLETLVKSKNAIFVLARYGIQVPVPDT